MSIPCGFAAGLPVGMQLIGPHFSEERLLNVAHRYQRETDWHRRAPQGVRADGTQWETVIGLEIHAQLATRSKIFSGSATAYGAAAEYPGQPGRPRLPRRAAGAERRGGAHGGDVRPGDRRRDRAALGVRAQELLLSRPAQGLPDQPVRAADRRPAATSTSCSRTARPSASASRARTWRRTPASRCTKTCAASPASTSTAPARRCSRSSPSRTCARRRKPSPT